MSGFFGVASKDDCVLELFYGVDYHSHLGTRRGGMAVYGEHGFDRAIHNIENTPFRTKFDGDVGSMKGNMGIGCISDYEPQPLLFSSRIGSFALTFVGKINNYDELLQQLYDTTKVHFQEMTNGTVNVTELIAALICEKDNFVEGIQYVQGLIDGSMTLLLMTKDGIYAARDKMGRTPVEIGRKEGSYCISFESHAYINLGYEDYKELGPGEIVFVTADEVKTLVEPGKKMKICSFLWVYYGFPTSTYEGKNVEEARFTNGFNLAKTDDVEVDCCSGIPDSGTGMAMGYAAGKGVPYQRCIAKYTPTWPRSFTPSNQSMRSLVAKMKLIPNKAMLKGKRVLFCDDSIVRGTQLRDNVKVLFDQAGLKECHMRIACPPLVYGCPFINFTSSKSDMELITRRIIEKFEGDANKNLEKYATTGSPEYQRMVDEIANQLGLTTLKFNTIEQLVEAIGLPKCQVCTHCFDGSSAYTLNEFADED